MQAFDSKSFLSRNAPIIDPHTQDLLSKLSIGLIGCGLASQLTESLTRIGVSRFAVWDFDNITISNLNRQAFRVEEIGMNKAEICAKHIHQINPETEVKVFPHKLVSSDCKRVSVECDIAVNSVDFDQPVIYEISDSMQKAGKWCIQPLNLGLGGACLVLGPDSMPLSELTQGLQTEPSDFIQNLLSCCVGFEPSDQLQNLGPRILAEAQVNGWFPQNIIATLITTAMVTWSIIQIALGRAEDIAAPRLLHFEPK